MKGVLKAAAVGLVSGCIAAAILTGCIGSAPIVPVTPDNQAQVSSCENTAQWRNTLVVGDFLVTGAGGGLGAAGALVPASNDSLKTDLAIGGAVAGAAALGITGLVAMTTSNFQNSQCQQVVGPLPVTPFGTKPVDAGAQ